MLIRSESDLEKVRKEFEQGQHARAVNERHQARECLEARDSLSNDTSKYDDVGIGR